MLGQSGSCCISFDSEWRDKYVDAIVMHVSHMSQKLYAKKVFYHRLIMGAILHKLTWPEVTKMINPSFVGMHSRIVPRRFQIIQTKTVFTARCWTLMPVPRWYSDFDLTRWPGPELLTKEVKICTQDVLLNCKQLCKKMRRCTPPFFLDIRENCVWQNVPPAVRVLNFLFKLPPTNRGSGSVASATSTA